MDSIPRGRLMSIHFSSETDDWATPPDLFDQVDREFNFDLDVCASSSNAKCPEYFTREDDGLLQLWAPRRCWMNPPYGRQIGRWLEKASDTAIGGGLVAALVPARTDTQWWHRWVMTSSEIRFVEGRIKFGGSKSAAPFPNALVIFRPGMTVPFITTWRP